MQLTLEIETGTHGKHVVKRLDILTKFDWVNKGRKTKLKIVRITTIRHLVSPFKGHR